MKAYPKYKEVGLDFLDSIPTHWDTKKLKFLSSVNFSNVDKHSFENEIPVRLCNYVDVYKNGFIKPDIDFMKATATQDEIDKFVLRKGDVLITKDSESWLDIAVPAYITKDMADVLCGYHLAQIRPASINQKFLFWVLCSSTLNDQYKVEAHGITRYGLGKDSIENSIIPIPSLPEQQAIAGFLDRKTSQIDALIEKKQRQIDLLQEQRTALINHAVTKGLNPDVPMKDSGVEWLGKIPSRWYIVPMRRLLDVRDGTHDTPAYIEPSSNSVPFVTSKDFDGDTINFSGAKYISPDDHQKFIQRSKVDKGDVLMSMIGGNIGKALIV
jgi:type I restriction enzyme, S subunit